MNKDVRKTKSLAPQTPSPWALGLTVTMLVLGATMSLSAWFAKLGINTPLLPAIGQWLNQGINSNSRLLFSHFLTGTGLLGTSLELTNPNAIKNLLQSWSVALVNLLTFGLLQKTWQRHTANTESLQHQVQPSMSKSSSNQTKDSDKNTSSDKTPEAWIEQKTLPATIPGVRGYDIVTEKPSDTAAAYTTSASCQA
jgi:hypothetical protein